MPLVSSFGINNDNLPKISAPVSTTTTITFNNNTGNVNNSIYWNGYSWHNMSIPFLDWKASFLFNYNQTIPTNLSGYALLNGSNQPFTGNLNINTDTPEYRLTDIGDNEYARLTRTDSSKEMLLRNRVSIPAGFGNAVKFNRINTSIDLADMKTYDRVTITAWFNNTGSLGGDVFSQASATAVCGADTIQSNTNAKGEFCFSNDIYSGAVNTGVNTVDSAWHFMAVSWNGSNVVVYLDGVYKAKSAGFPDTYTITLNATQKIGSYFNGVSALFNGTIDEVVIWNRSLSASEVNDLYNSASGVYGNPLIAPFNSGLVAGWHLDESSGLIASDFYNGANGTLTTSTSWVTGLITKASTTTESQIISSKNGINQNEEGIITFGHNLGRTIIQGTNITALNNMSIPCITFADGTTQCSAFQTWNFNQSTPFFDWKASFLFNYNQSGSGTGVSLSANNIWTGVQNFWNNVTIKNSSLTFINDYTNTSSPTGGTITTDGLYTVHTFTSNGSFNVSGNLDVQVLVVGGGASGGAGVGGSGGGGGGGAGGYNFNNSVSIVPGSYNIIIGLGGIATAYGNIGNNGGNSTFGNIINASGGGGGGGSTFGSPPLGRNGTKGGSGGGSSATNTITGRGGAGTTGQGYSGGNGSVLASPYRGGGGGGSNGTGSNGGSSSGNGGNGSANNINGSVVYYSGGGGSGVYINSGTGGVGGLGGGGAGATGQAGNGWYTPAGSNGTNGLGGGGGGGASNANDNNFGSPGGYGGSGIVIIRYLTSDGGTGGLANGTISYNSSGFYFNNYIHATDFLVNSKVYSGDALNIIKNLKTFNTGVEFEDVDYSKSAPNTEGKLSFSLLLKALQQLITQEDERDTEITEMKAELCTYKPYNWCPG